METKLFKIFVSLGVPGLALGVFYMLFRHFGWEFPVVPSNWVGPIIVLFMLLTSGVVFYALSLWRPQSNTSPILYQNNATISGAAALEKLLKLLNEVLERQSEDIVSSGNSDASNQKELIDSAKAAVQRGANHTRHYIAGRRSE